MRYGTTVFNPSVLDAVNLGRTAGGWESVQVAPKLADRRAPLEEGPEAPAAPTRPHVGSFLTSMVCDHELVRKHPQAPLCRCTRPHAAACPAPSWALCGETHVRLKCDAGGGPGRAPAPRQAFWGFQQVGGRAAPFSLSLPSVPHWEDVTPDRELTPRAVTQAGRKSSLDDAPVKAAEKTHPQVYKTQWSAHLNISFLVVISVS